MAPAEWDGLEVRGSKQEARASRVAALEKWHWGHCGLSLPPININQLGSPEVSKLPFTQKILKVILGMAW